MLPRQEMEARVVPMALDHGVRSELVTVPGRENEPAWKPLENVSEFRFVRLRP